MKTLFILNDAPYGTERSYNGLRLALSLVKGNEEDELEIRLFLIGDAVGCAKSGQTTPEGQYNIERMLKGLTSRGVQVGACGSCLDARGFTETDLAPGICRSSMAQLADWTLWADKVISF